MIPVASGARIWIATGHADMRKGMQGLALLKKASGAILLLATSLCSAAVLAR